MPALYWMVQLLVRAPRLMAPCFGRRAEWVSGITGRGDFWRGHIDIELLALGHGVVQRWCSAWLGMG